MAGLVLNRLLPDEADKIDFLRAACEQQRQVLGQVAQHLDSIAQIRLPMTRQKLRGRAGLRWLADVIGRAGDVSVRKQKLPDSEAAGQ